MSNIYLVPLSFPCEKCGATIKIKLFTLDNFICDICKTTQRREYYGKLFGMITNVKD